MSAPKKRRAKAFLVPRQPAPPAPVRAPPRPMCCGGCGWEEFSIATRGRDYSTFHEVHIECTSCGSTTVLSVSASIDVDFSQLTGDGVLAPAPHPRSK